MFNKLFLALFFLFITNQILFSQDKGLGIKGGITTSYLSAEINNSYFALDFNSDIGFNAGAFVDVFSKENFMISAELYFNRKAATGKSNYVFFTQQSDDEGVEFLIDYLEYGVPLKYSFTKGSFIPYIYLEPRVNFYLGSEVSNSKDSIPQSFQNIIKENMTKFGFGMSGGIGSDIKLKKGLSLLFEIQFSPDFFDTYSSDDFKIKSNSMEFRTGFRFY